MARASDFGPMLRAFRGRLTPDAAGLAATSPAARRVAGLRRSELAHLAGASEEHVKRLEQGRRLPSAGMVDALARALRLDRADHERLRLAAGFAGPHGHRAAPHGPDDDRVPREIMPAAQRILDRLTEVPACLCDATWNVLTGNRRWLAFNCDAASADGRDRNIAWRTFTDAPSTVFRSPAHLTAFRAAVVAGLRTVDDPDLGRFTLDKDVLTVEPGDLRVVVLSAPANSPDADRIAALAPTRAEPLWDKAKTSEP